MGAGYCLHISSTAARVRPSTSWSAGAASTAAAFTHSPTISSRYNGTRVKRWPPASDRANISMSSTVRVSSSGQVTAAMNLADDSKVSQSATLSANGTWPMYGSGSGESIIGWLTFADGVHKVWPQQK